MANELEKNTETNPAQNEQNNESTPDTAELEAKIKQLESENNKLRQANTNASADASKWKKQYQDKLSEEERKKEEQDDQNRRLQEELESLRAERNVASYKSQLVAPDIGFEATLAQEVAEALNKGELVKVFDGLRKFLVAHDKALKENAFRQNPTLQGGSQQKAISKEQFDKMGYKERLEVFNNHPDLYKEYTQ